MMHLIIPILSMIIVLLIGWVLIKILFANLLFYIFFIKIVVYKTTFNYM